MWSEWFFHVFAALLFPVYVAWLLWTGWFLFLFVSTVCPFTVYKKLAGELETIADSVPVGIVYLDRERVYQYCNGEYAALLQRPKEQGIETRNEYAAPRSPYDS